MPTPDFLKHIQKRCKQHGVVLILDEIQSGCGRTGKFFAHQHAGIQPDLITMAKGMGNGYPVGGVLISPDIKPWSGMLGTTFGGNYLACAAALAVLEVIVDEDLIANAAEVGTAWMEQLSRIEGLTAVRGKGLMIGLDLPEEKKTVRNELLFKHRIFTGEAKPNTIRLLPPLTLCSEEAAQFTYALTTQLAQANVLPVNP